MKRINVKIVRSTAKAYLVADSLGREAWVQRRWLAKDGTVAIATFEKSVTRSETRKAQADEDRAWKQAYHQILVAKETEKAIGVEVVFEASNVEKTIRRLAWLPKSIIKNGAAPGWVLLDRVSKAADEIRSQYQFAALGLCNPTIGGVEV